MNDYSFHNGGRRFYLSVSTAFFHAPKISYTTHKHAFFNIVTKSITIQDPFT